MYIHVYILSLSVYVYIYIVIVCNHEITHKLCNLPRQDIYRYIKLYGPFLWCGGTASRLDKVTTRRQFTFYQKFLVLIRSIPKR